MKRTKRAQLIDDQETMTTTDQITIETDGGFVSVVLSDSNPMIYLTVAEDDIGTARIALTKSAANRISNLLAARGE